MGGGGGEDSGGGKGKKASIVLRDEMGGVVVLGKGGGEEEERSGDDVPDEDELLGRVSFLWIKGFGARNLVLAGLWCSLLPEQLSLCAGRLSSRSHPDIAHIRISPIA